MNKLKDIKLQSVFKYFEEISLIPRGSGDMGKISAYCMDFAKNHSLKAHRDSANNVIIYKDGTKGYEDSEPIILQGHLDMVCQKDEGVDFDFEKDSLDIYVDGDYIKAHGTTLGGDNGVAVAMILSILERDDIEHPPIEAVFTTDEEIGMVGALSLDFTRLKGRKMINTDSEEPGVVTVSCAGGSDLTTKIEFKKKSASGSLINITVKGLKGGHSGVEINKGRVNANILMGRILRFVSNSFDFDIVNINGGDKANAIPLFCSCDILAEDGGELVIKLNEYANIIKEEMSARESDLKIDVTLLSDGTYEVLDTKAKDDIIYALNCVPNGVIDMSMEIENLVETSVNLGILKTEEEYIILHHALRSNKTSSLEFLEDRLRLFYSHMGYEVETGGHYPPWEYNDKSRLQGIYCDTYKELCGKDAEVKAIHAGLECGVFSSNIKGFDCISIGPEMHDIHTTKERLSISSTEQTYEIILNILRKSK
jgi:dipeptidase D